MDSKVKFIAIIAIVVIIIAGAAAAVVMSNNDDDDSEDVDITIQGSTTIAPIMTQVEKDYEAAHSNVHISMTANGSGTGAKAAIDGSADIGMMSRDLKDSEKTAGLVPTVIGKDGIVMVINNSVTGISSLTLEQVKDLFTGKITNWNQLGGNDMKVVLEGREASSGTRGAFEEIVGIGADVSKTMEENGSNAQLFTNVKKVTGAVGYVSLGYVIDDKDTNKTYFAAQIGGVDATIDNVLNGTYTLQRNLNLATLHEPTGAVKELIDYILSPAGQKTVEDKGYIPVGSTKVVTGGDIAVQGSTTIAPIMTQIEENYEKLHSDVKISMTANGSGTGAKAAIDGSADIGMMSRDLKDSEKTAGLVPTVIGKDGIAIVINNSVTGVTNLTMEQVKDLFTGKVTNWNQLGGNDQKVVLEGREASSGTRGAFEEIVGIGADVSKTMEENGSNAQLFTNVKKVTGAVGYVSLGYVIDDKDTNKTYFAAQIGGVDATIDNVVSGDYKLQRNLNLATKGTATGAAADLIEYILSVEGQKVVEEKGYIPVGPTHYSGSIDIQGSTTIAPIMTQIEEDYEKKYSDVKISMTANGSGTGAKAVIDGTAGLGMLSRDLKQSETDAGLVPTVIGKDGIAIVINKSVTGVDSLTIDQVKQLYTGKITNWKDLGGNDMKVVLEGREASSGTRGAFEEIVGIGTDIDKHMQENASNSALFSTVKQTDGAVGYVSLGYVIDDKDANKTYFAAKIGGVEATIDNVVDGTYELQRNLNLATKGPATGIAADIIDYILSEEGQKVVEEKGYIPVKN